MQFTNEFSVDFSMTSSLERCLMMEYEPSTATQLSNLRIESSANILNEYFSQTNKIKSHLKQVQILVK